MTIRYTKSFGAQLITAEMITAGLVSFTTPFREMDSDSQIIIKKIAERIRSIKYHLTAGTMDLTMHKKDADKYQQKMMRVKAVLNELMAEHAGLDYLNCLLALSEDVVEASCVLSANCIQKQSKK